MHSHPGYTLLQTHPHLKQYAYFPQPHCEAWKPDKATTEMETTMNTRHNWIFGLAGLGLAMAAPVQAAPDFLGGMLIVAQSDRARESQREPREVRKDRDGRRESKREIENEEPRGYGYGYERRQKRDSEDDDRNRSRR
jgi:hypothetical protein